MYFVLLCNESTCVGGIYDLLSLVPRFPGGEQYLHWLLKFRYLKCLFFLFLFEMRALVRKKKVTCSLWFPIPGGIGQPWLYNDPFFLEEVVWLWIGLPIGYPSLSLLSFVALDMMNLMVCFFSLGFGFWRGFGWRSFHTPHIWVTMLDNQHYWPSHPLVLEIW